VKKEPKKEKVPKEDTKPASKNWMDLNKVEEEVNSSEDEAIQIENEKKEKKSRFKKEQIEKLMKGYDDEKNWNYLFMNPDSVASAMAQKLHVSKGELLETSQNKQSLAVRIAQAETVIINNTKEWMKTQGLDIDLLEKITDRQKCKRSTRILLAKNIPYSMTVNELRALFDRYGRLNKCELSPFNTLALVEFDTERQAMRAIQKL